MARRIVEVFNCDFCQRPIEDDEQPTISFSWSGTDYEVDLCSDDRTAVLDGDAGLRKLMEVARPGNRQSAPVKRRKRSTHGSGGVLERYREGDSYLCPGCSREFKTATALGVHHRVHGFALVDLEGAAQADIEARGSAYAARFAS
jgi:hypothetical protein